uniref:CRISPR-associated endonuclease Cas1 n=1 Tax=Arsenophonus endosymbiont of Trialeurodes vaporariorum TaxID=235567 RepID=A0A3B0MJE8_9GAMM
MEVDDSSLKWLDAEGNIVRLPVAMLNTILLGPGTTLTDEAVKTAAAANFGICWVGEYSLLFYAAGFQPTANSRNMRQQAMISCNRKAALEVARRMFGYRFPDADLKAKSLKEMMGMEGAPE